MESEPAFVCVSKDIRVPKSTKKNVIGRAIPSGKEIDAYNASQRRDTVIDVFSFRQNFRNRRKITQWAHIDEQVVNDSWSFPIVVNTNEQAIRGVMFSKSSGDIGPRRSDGGGMVKNER
jgi:hypothetical protein